MLELEDIQTFYGASQILFDVSLRVDAGEMVTLMGRNGMGKTTTVRSIMGLVRPRAGKIRFQGVEIQGRPSHLVARAGIGLVPEGRQVFPNLTVRENLEVAAGNASGSGTPGRARRTTAAGDSAAGADNATGAEPWTVADIYEMFPALGARANLYGRALSGGEQQMLAIGRALMTNARLILLDEATEGLAPLVCAEIWRCLEGLKAAGQAILLIDSNHGALMQLADRHYIMEKGRITWTGDSAALRAADDVRQRYLGV